LTAITQKEEIWTKHFLDSVMGAYAFEKGATVAEVGSGGGFPSIPLMILRDDLKITLIESVGKKCEFLQIAIEKLGLVGARVVYKRAEEVARDLEFREKFDVACARAVARLNTLCEYCVPLVKVGGKFVAYKGNADEEVKEAAHAIQVLGGKLERVEQYELPQNGGARAIVEIRKVKATPLQYPRGQGKERKKPL
jgi:16S rRNA (guanine527-N7)-methyltransferase